MVAPLIAFAVLAGGLAALFGHKKDVDKWIVADRYYNEEARIAKLKSQNTLALQRSLYAKAGVAFSGTPELVGTETIDFGNLQAENIRRQRPDAPGPFDLGIGALNYISSFLGIGGKLKDAGIGNSTKNSFGNNTSNNIPNSIPNNTSNKIPNTLPNNNSSPKNF